MKKFDKNTRSTFSYWFWHWLAYQKTAMRLGVWKPKYILHDIEKPWLLLFWKDYKRVQKWHREHNNHHLTYKGGYDKIDWKALAIDWECCHLTKKAQPYNAFGYMLERIKEHPNEKDLLETNLLPILKDWRIDYYHNDDED